MKILIRIAVVLLGIGFILIPLALYVLIPMQGSKILKTPVKVRSVYFNPLTLDLKINGLAILDSKQQPVVGFRQLDVDVSLFDLVKGKYRVQKVALDGFNLAVVMLPDGHINLLDIVNNAMATQTTQAKQTKKPAAAPAPSSGKPQDIPLVVVDKIIVSDGMVTFKDQSITPNFATKLHGININLNGLSTDPTATAHVVFKARLDEKGVITNEASIKPLAVPLSLETTFGLNSYALTVLSPYVGKYTGRALQDGGFDLQMTYRISDNKLAASHKILIQHFKFGEKVESKDALHLPFGLAIALLEDPQGKIKISLPVKGDMSDPKFEYWHLVGQVVSNFFTKLVTKPFMFLASLVTGSEESTDELASVKFTPGQFELTVPEQEKLKVLSKSLMERPKLRLKINGSFDPDLDWKAIKAEMFHKDYTQLREDSKRADTMIYRQLYQRRFGIRALWQLARKYKKAIGEYNDQDFDQEMKKQLIENAPADKGALDVLGAGRAQVVFNYLQSQGFDLSRLEMGQSQPVMGSMGSVPLEFTLTVIE